MSEKITILYVEDEPEILEQMEWILQRYADRLYTAHDGEEGWKLFQKHRPDLVISDIIMPRMDGIAMAWKIKEIAPEQPLLFLTAKSDSDSLLEGIELQVDGYILKPIDLELLTRKIRQVLQRVTLRKKYERTRLILEEIAHYQGGPLALLDEEYRPIFLNLQMSNLLGYPMEKAEEELGEEGLSRRFWKALFPETCSIEDCSRQAKRKKLLDKLRKMEYITLHPANSDESKQFKIDLSHIHKSGHTILSLAEVTQIVHQRRYYEERANTDALTGLFNRHYFDTFTTRKLGTLHRNGTSFCLSVFDLDHFKSVNDRYGHLVGDQVLVEFARLLQKEMDRKTIAARWGGEEFVVFRWDLSKEECLLWAEALREKIERVSFSDLDLSVTVSIGIAYSTNTGKKLVLPELFAEADRALYRAKQNGRNRVESIDLSRTTEEE